MSHNIAIIRNRAQAWYADKPAWHGLGDVTEGSKTARQVVKQVPLFKRRVELRPVYVRIGGRNVEAADYRATVRQGDDQPLGIVSKEYSVLQDTDGLMTMEAIVREAGSRKAGFVSAFGLGHGERVAACIDLSRVLGVHVKRDPSKQEAFMFGTWAHDGTGALNVGLWNNRVDCNNMLNMARAYAEAKGLSVSIRHTGDVESRLREAREVLGFASIIAKAHVAEMNALADIPVTKPYVDEYLQELVPIPEDMERTRSREEARAVIASLFKKSKTLVGVPESGYRLYQATVEYADHWRPLRIGPDAERNIVTERRFRSITEGPAARMKAQALDILTRDLIAAKR